MNRPPHLSPFRFSYKERERDTLSLLVSLDSFLQRETIIDIFVSIVVKLFAVRRNLFFLNSSVLNEDNAYGMETR